MLHKAQKESFHQVGLFPALPCKLLLELFPFGIIVNPDMKILGSGDKFIDIWRGEDTFLNKSIEQFFTLRRPKGITFSWKNVSKILYHNNFMPSVLSFNNGLKIIRNQFLYTKTSYTVLRFSAANSAIQLRESSVSLFFI